MSTKKFRDDSKSPTTMDTDFEQWKIEVKERCDRKLLKSKLIFPFYALLSFTSILCFDIIEENLQSVNL